MIKAILKTTGMPVEVLTAAIPQDLKRRVCVRTPNMDGVFEIFEDEIEYLIEAGRTGRKRR